MKYNKKILKEHTEYLFNQYYTLYILDDKDYFNIHIVCDTFKDAELNTLYLQEFKQDVSFSEFDDLYITKLLLEFTLWNKFYGYKDKSYQFEIKDTVDIDFSEQTA